jgi:biotin carboxyl carrier protein
VKLKITIDDRTYEVEVAVADETQAPRAIAGPVEPSKLRVPASPSPASSGGAAVSEEQVCRSPITGTVVRIVAHPGLAIQPGDILLVLEAMKMETNITAPVAGKVKAITVNAGDAVKAEQVVVELE